MSVTIKSKNIGDKTKDFFKPGFISIPNAVGFFFPEDDEKTQTEKKKSNVSEFFFPEDDEKEAPKDEKKKSITSYIKGIAGRFAIATAVGIASFSSVATAHEAPQAVPPQAVMVIDYGIRSITSFSQKDMDTCLENIRLAIKTNHTASKYEEFIEKVGDVKPFRTYYSGSGSNNKHTMTCFKQ